MHWFSIVDEVWHAMVERPWALGQTDLDLYLPSPPVICELVLLTSVRLNIIFFDYSTRIMLLSQDFCEDLRGTSSLYITLG